MGAERVDDETLSPEAKPKTSKHWDQNFLRNSTGSEQQWRGGCCQGTSNSTVALFAEAKQSSSPSSLHPTIELVFKFPPTHTEHGLGPHQPRPQSEMRGSWAG